MSRVDTKVMLQIIDKTPGRLSQLMDAVATEVVSDLRLNAPVDKGILRASISWDVTGQYQRTAHDGVIYGQYNEYGNTRGMQPRPWFAPVFEDWSSKFGPYAVQFELIQA